MLRLFDAVTWAAGMFGAFLLVFIVGLTTTDMLLRNLAGSGIRGQLEYVEYALFAASFLLAPWVLSHGAHVRVEFAIGLLSTRAKALVERAVWFCGALLCASLTIFATIETWLAFDRGARVIKAVIFPEWWALIVMPFSFALLTVEFTRRAAGLRASNEQVGL